MILAEDDQDVRESLSLLLELDGYEVKALTSGRELLDVTMNMERRGTPPTLLVSDHCLPEMSGLDAIEAIDERMPTPPTVLVTAFADARVVERVEELGIVLVQKPFSVDHLLDVVKRTIEDSREAPRHCSACRERTGLRARGAALFCQSCRRIADTSDPDDAMLDLGRGN